MLPTYHEHGRINDLRCQAPSNNLHVIATHPSNIFHKNNSYHLNLFTPLPDNRGIIAMLMFSLKFDQKKSFVKC